jgi:hypothetical protein
MHENNWHSVDLQVYAVVMGDIVIALDHSVKMFRVLNS